MAKHNNKKPLDLWAKKELLKLAWEIYTEPTYRYLQQQLFKKDIGQVEPYAYRLLSLVVTKSELEYE